MKRAPGYFERRNKLMNLRVLMNLTGFKISFRFKPFKNYFNVAFPIWLPKNNVI